MADITGARTLLDGFKAMVERHSSGPVPAEVNEHLTKLKLAIMGFPALPPSSTSTPTEAEEVTIAREAMEQATILSAKAEDSRAFDRYVVQVRALYADFAETVPVSPQAPTIYGLHLLFLLTENRLAHFHSELELIPEEAQSHELVAYPIRLEEWLMEGSYNKILTSCAAVPSPVYQPFVARITDTVRDEIADCSAASYDTLAVEAAQRMMVFSSADDLLAYVHEKQPEWHVEAGVIHFNAEQKARLEVPAMTLIANTLAYATELERIV